MSTEKHAILSPSSAERWVRCPASAAYKALYDTNRMSDAAKLGTAMHSLAKALLLDQSTAPNDPAPESVTIDGVDLTEDHVQIVDTYVAAIQDEVRAARLLYEDTHIIKVAETPVSIEAITSEPNARGTPDWYMLTPSELQVWDLKTGYKEVSPYDNRQLSIYAQAVINRLDYVVPDDFPVTLGIVQPTLRAEPQRMHTTAFALRQFTADIRSAGEMALDLFELAKGYGHCHIDDIRESERPGIVQCQYCPGAKAGMCTTYNHLAASVGATVSAMVDTVGGLHADAMNARIVPLLRQWCDDTLDRVTHRVLSGENISGWKAVAGREGNRKWEDEKLAARRMIKAGIASEDRYVKKVISPAVAEKLLKAVKDPVFDEGKTALMKLIDRKPAALTVVEESDPRPRVNVALINQLDFPIIDEV